MSYTALKFAHMLLACVSGLFFMTRFCLFRFQPALRNRATFKILPHIIDTALLVFAILLSIHIAQYPLTHNWLTAKVLGLLAYISFGMIAMRRQQVLAFMLALTSYGYILGVAFLKTPLSWLAPLVGTPA